MEDLKKYKQVWQNQKHTDSQINATTINRMIHKKSSSLVKWIFYISMIEFSVFILLDIFTKKDWNNLKVTGMYWYTIISFIVFYTVIILFVYLFYKNYKAISVTSDAKSLMKNILKARQSVKYYIITNIVMLAIGTVVAANISFQDPEYQDMIENLTENHGMNGSYIAWGIVISLVVVFGGILLLVYQLLYGILLRKLKENYRELIRE